MSYYYNSEGADHPSMGKDITETVKLGFEPCICRWQKTFQVMWRKRSGSYWYRVNTHKRLICPDDPCKWPEWTHVSSGSKPLGSMSTGDYKIGIDKCSTCDCDKEVSDLDLGDLVVSKGWLKKNEVPAWIMLIINETSGPEDEIDHDAIMTDMKAELTANNESLEPPSDSEMEGLCKRGTSVNLT